jgi:predicted secreted protein with PEFG-CTERM motif
MILAARTALVLYTILVLGLANYVTANESNITHFMVGSAFAQTDTTSGGNSTDPNVIPQDNSTYPNTIPQNNSTDLGTNPLDNPADPYPLTQDNSTVLTDTQNQTSNAATPEFGPVSILVLTIGVISIILVPMRNRFSWNIK